MGKKKAENVEQYPPEHYGMEPGEEIKIEEQADLTPAERMAKARAARIKGGRNGRAKPMPASEMKWFLLGLKDQQGSVDVIHEYPNSFQLRKGYAAMEALLQKHYLGVAVIRGKYYKIEHL